MAPYDGSFPHVFLNTVADHAVTSTVSTGTGNQGVDPNRLASITDKLAFSIAVQDLT